MKKVFFVLLLGAFSLWGDAADAIGGNNDFYGRAAFIDLETLPLVVDGEVENPGPVDLEALPRHMVTVRHADWHHQGRGFAGAYRFEGVSLFDILRDRLVKKTAGEVFPPPVDLFMEIHDNAGEVVVVSWGEVFYSRTPHRVLVATRVSPIVPTKVKSVSAMPSRSLLVCGDDLYAVRNLTAPRRITVRSAKVNIPIRRGMAYVSSQSIRLNILGEDAAILRDPLRFPAKRSQPSVFFGRGRGFHGFQDFQGWDLGAVLEKYINIEPDILARGYLVVTAADGYRVVFAASEVFNRNDGNAFMLLDGGLCENKGPWALFPGPDFFSDRAISGINAIRIEKLE